MVCHYHFFTTFDFILILCRSFLKHTWAVSRILFFFLCFRYALFRFASRYSLISVSRLKCLFGLLPSLINVINDLCDGSLLQVPKDDSVLGLRDSIIDKKALVSWLLLYSDWSNVTVEVVWGSIDLVPWYLPIKERNNILCWIVGLNYSCSGCCAISLPGIGLDNNLKYSRKTRVPLHLRIWLVWSSRNACSATADLFDWFSQQLRLCLYLLHRIEKRYPVGLLSSFRTSLPNQREFKPKTTWSSKKWNRSGSLRLCHHNIRTYSRPTQMIRNVLRSTKDAQDTFSVHCLQNHSFMWRGSWIIRARGKVGSCWRIISRTL